MYEHQIGQERFTAILATAMDETLTTSDRRGVDTATVAADLYPILFTSTGLRRIEGHSDHAHGSALHWDCTCGETFSTTFDGRDEMFDHIRVYEMDEETTYGQLWDALVARFGFQEGLRWLIAELYRFLNITVWA